MDSASAIILAISLFVIMLGMGLTLVVDDFKRIILYPRAIFLGLVNQLVLLPLIGFSILMLIPVSPEIAVGIMILVACPGGPTSNLITHLAKGDLALSVSLTALSSVLTIITIPFIVNFALTYFLDQEHFVKLDVWTTISQIIAIVILPVCIGMIIRHYRSNFSMKMAKPVRISSGVLLAIIIVGILIKEQENFVTYFKQAGIAALMLNVLTMLVGFYSAKLFRIKNKQAISISIETGIQNGTLAITIAVVLLENSAFAIAAAVYSLIMFFTGGVVIYLGIKKAAL